MPWQGEFRHAQTTSALEAVLQRHIDSLGDPPGFPDRAMPGQALPGGSGIGIPESESTQVDMIHS